MLLRSVKKLKLNKKKQALGNGEPVLTIISQNINTARSR